MLLDGVVERYRENIQTQQIRKLSDIAAEDCDRLEAGMAKCSTWLAGHDQTGAVNEAVPGPEELEADIDALDEWVNEIRKRRY